MAGGGGAQTLFAVPNFSAGPNRAALGEIGAALSSAAIVLDLHADAVHNRSVFTIAAPAADLPEALEAGATAAIAGIDMGEHAGAHPRIGAIDVCPVVYPDPARRVIAIGAAREIGARLGERGLPVFLYGELATSPERIERHHFRSGGFETLATRMAAGELAPDLGPAEPHPTAGATLVTARPPLAAFNVELAGVEIEAGREIAAALREFGGGMTGVRAIAIRLSPETVQISTNVHDPVATTLAQVIAEIERLATESGGRAAAAELIGLVPEGALRDYPEHVPIRDFDPASRTIEARLAELG
jgi:glutamate formiminotransferase/glutamate formiminotransferase/formiminotetrahydrofolate cyclodeaminase